MAYLALYRKYRPQSFDEVVGQKAVIKTLTNALKNNKIAHAYLFCGPRGTGKTSLARLFAKSLNCSEGVGEECNKCDNCLAVIKGNHPDVFEVDAASNSGVDNVRQLIEQVSFQPILGRYKVYIIDGADLMNEQKQNTLLKTLEEPPEFVTFILTAKSSDAFLPTVLSRCAVLSMRPVEDTVLEKALLEKLGDPDPTALRRAVMLSCGYIGAALELYKKRDDELFERCERFAEAFVRGEWLGMTELLTFAGKDARQKFTEFVSALEKYIKRCFGYAVAGLPDGLSETEKALAALGTEKLSLLCGAVATTAENSNINVNLNLWSVYTVKRCREIR